MKEQQISRGKKNWMKLKNIILSKNLAHKQRDKKMTLFSKIPNVSEGKLITHYVYADSSFMQAAPQPIFKELVEFQSEIDATGKWIWEAEEVAAYYFINQCQRYLKLCSNKQPLKQNESLRVLELGAGCSGLAGIALVKELGKLAPEINVQLILTDGQIENIEFLNLNLQLNGLKNVKNRSTLLKWGSHSLDSNFPLQTSFSKSCDLIIICDCLYFTDFHKELISQMDYYLAQQGCVVFVNPSRGESMKTFLQLCREAGYQWKFIDFKNEKYLSQCNKISKCQNFNKQKDICYFIEVQRHSKQNPGH